MKNQALEDKIQAMYNNVPEDIKEDIVEACLWAKNTLTNFEGSGHQIFVTAEYKTQLVVCSFAKPEWAGDHCGRGMDHGAEAIVMAVCEYMCGA
jgi:hypothetical protein